MTKRHHKATGGITADDLVSPTQDQTAQAIMATNALKGIASGNSPVQSGDDAPRPRHKPVPPNPKPSPSFGGYASGGGVIDADDQPGSFHGGGLFNSLGSGRTDIHNRDVPSGGYVVPADVVAGLAEGNTMGGSAVISRMMNSGPYGTSLPKKGSGRGDFPKLPGIHPSPMGNPPKAGGITGELEAAAKGGHIHRAKKKDQGNGEPVPVVVAGGEYYINPQSIINKFGSLERGHQILDKWILARREKNIKELKKLPGPKK